MGMLRQKLPDLRPGPFILAFWLLGLATPAIQGNSIVAALVGTIVAMLWLGYPYAVALSVPADDIRPSVRRAAQFMGAGFVVVIVAVAVILAFIMPSDHAAAEFTFEEQPVLAMACMLMALFANAVIFGSFFIGTMGLNDYRSATGTATALMSLPTLLAFFYGPFGGWVYTQRRLREAKYAG